MSVIVIVAIVLSSALTRATLTASEYTARMKPYTNDAAGHWMREFDFLVESKAFRLGETYFIVAPDDSAARCTVLSTLWGLEWRASLVRARVTRFTSCYGMLCTIQSTDEPGEKRENYRSVFHHGRSYPAALRHDDCLPTGWSGDMFVQLPCADWPCAFGNLSVSVVKIAL